MNPFARRFFVPMKKAPRLLVGAFSYLPASDWQTLFFVQHSVYSF